MSNVFDRTAGVYLESVNTPDYPTADYIINPDVSALSAVPRRYWKASGDRVVEMDSVEKDVVDTANAVRLTPEHADNTAALAAGLRAESQYRTGDILKIVH